MATLRIPLFPLDLVLFPGNSLPLHIFEPRYKLMIRRAIDDGGIFGLILARENGVAHVGCSAEVLRLLKTYDDGRMDIKAIGRVPFRVAQLHQENPLLEATVEMLEDEPQSDAGPDAEQLAEQLFTLYAGCHTLLHTGPPEPLDNLPRTELSYQIAGRLPLDHEVQQELLEIRSEAARRGKLAGHLDDLLQQLSSIRLKQSKAGSNGHGSPWIN